MPKPLTQLSIKKLTKTGFHRDGKKVGLYVQVKPAAGGGVSRSFLYRFTSPVTKTERWMGLGSCDLVTLAEARDMAHEHRRMVRIEKLDPIEERAKAAMVAEEDRVRRMTFADCCHAYLEQRGPSFGNTKHRNQWHSTLARACDQFGKVNVADVDTAMIVKLLTPIWKKTPETGSRLRSRIEKVLDWATVAELREGDNPARWKGHLEHVLTREEGVKKHHASMPFVEVPAFCELLRSRDSLSAKALEFTILTAARTKETIGACWDEIDLEAKTWTVPAERMKGKVEHVVALSNRAVELLNSIERKGELIFPLSNMAMTQVLRKAGAGDYTVHGFRSSFSTWANERTKFSRQVVEFALAHQIKNKVERAYNRTNQLPQRVKLMESWGEHTTCPHQAAHILPFGVAS